MLKLITLLNLSGLFLFRVLFLTDVIITQDAPTTMQAGTEVKVTVTIDKGQLNGFAKLQIDLPEGLSATAIETKGASFTFADGKAKFIWMALPTQPQFKVSYTLSAAATATGSLPINGKFSYIEDNERKTEELATTSVTITGGTVAQDVTTPASATESTPVADNANDITFAGAAAPVKEAEIVATSGIAPQQGAGNVSATRTITLVTENELLVEVHINKGSIRGFGKLQETIPSGFTALEKNSSEAIFTTQDRIAKFVWLNLPAASEIKVVYKLRANDLPEAEYTVNGEFGYLLNDETQKAVLGSTNFQIGAKALLAQQQALAQNASNAGTAGTTVTMGDNTASSTQQNTTTQQSTSGQQQSTSGTATKEGSRSGAGDNATAQAGTKPKVTPRVSGPETGVTYKVQISAAHREVGSSYFVERHHYNGDFSIERHEGWIKYVTGRFPEYRSARDQRQAYVEGSYNFPGPFVTAYNNGDRITVQEALMISNQKWVQ